jgi:CheY-like chemotaxis protein
LEKRLALVIEDDIGLAEIFTEAMRAAQLKVEVIQDGSKALLRLEEVVPSIIILDLHLPNSSGTDILDHILAHPHLQETRVIVATGDALGGGDLWDKADLVLLKPISFGQLRDLSRRLVFPHQGGSGAQKAPARHTNNNKSLTTMDATDSYLQSIYPLGD